MLLRYTLRRRLSARRPPAPEVSDSELDFFFGGTDAAAQHLANSAFRFFPPDYFHNDAAQARCDDILSHRVRIFGETFDVGSPVQWRRDFRTGREWPREHTSTFRLATREGDVKMPWELSRFHHGVALALGYARTGDERYAREWASQFHAWRTDNPPEHGPNWGNAMEAAIRAANWLAAFELMRPALDRATGESFLKALIQHGRFIASHLEEYWPPTNHILANLCGLIWLGMYLRPSGTEKPRGLEADRWLDFGLRELQKQLRFQILPDGASYEASTAYHRFVAEMVGSTVRLCELNDVLVPSSVRDAAAKMESVIAGLCKPDGALPLFGDEDGGMWLPHLRSPASGSYHPQGWTSFPHAGWFIHRSGDKYLAIRAGDNGQAGWGGHAHNDALGFEFAIGARTFLVDPGAYTYTADPDSRNLFRSTAYHNTLRVDGEEISRFPPGELFRLEDDVRCRGVACDASTWSGEHTGYRRIGVTHRRRFEETGGGWRIADTVTGEGEHVLEWFFHFAPDCPLKLDGPNAATGFAEDPNIKLISNPQSLFPVLYQGWVSPIYGQRVRAPIVRYAAKAMLPVTVEFVIHVL